MNKFQENTISTEKIFDGKVISVKVDKVELPDGKIASREIVNHPGAVAIIAITDDKKIVLVDQFRKPLERSIIEIPAGKLEKGEEPLETAKRELEEETGYRANEFKYVLTFATSPGFADEIIHIYVAKGLYEAEDKLEADDDEFVELMEVTIEEAEKLIDEQKIYDAKTIFAIQWLKLNEL